ncbi:hypothetical protein SAY87_020038 [Trapa incisa]|uniref:Plastid movement impaired 2 n=1 Tax=Trapa incisa TaxID=236973 RepID=A0AAN7K6N8_9MYRT|nr:hypothetical protein SAY87_020038 [Trapa incisa]
MGNFMGGRDQKVAKVMKITGDILKFKAPVTAGEVLKDHPGLVLLDSESVKHYGVRAKPLPEHQLLRPRRLYFLLELPKEKGVPRRVRSGIAMTAKDRLENLMLSRRSTSDLSAIAKAAASPGNDGGSDGLVRGHEEAVGSSGTRLKLRLPKEEVERLMRESKDEAEAAERIMRLYVAGPKNHDGPDGGDNLSEDGSVGGSSLQQQEQQQELHSSHGRRNREGPKKREKKRVSFMAVREGEMQMAVAS